MELISQYKINTINSSFQTLAPSKASNNLMTGSISTTNQPQHQNLTKSSKQLTKTISSTPATSPSTYSRLPTTKTADILYY